MVDVQTISIVVAAAGVFIAAINSIISSRRAEEQRQLTLETQQQALETWQAQLFMRARTDETLDKINQSTCKNFSNAWKPLFNSLISELDTSCTRCSG